MLQADLLHAGPRVRQIAGKFADILEPLQPVAGGRLALEQFEQAAGQAAPGLGPRAQDADLPRRRGRVARGSAPLGPPDLAARGADHRDEVRLRSTASTSSPVKASRPKKYGRVLFLEGAQVAVGTVRVGFAVAGGVEFGDEVLERGLLVVTCLLPNDCREQVRERVALAQPPVLNERASTIDETKSDVAPSCLIAS